MINGRADITVYRMTLPICHQISGRVMIARLDAKSGAIIKIISARTLITPKLNASAVFFVDLLRLVRWSAKLRGSQSDVPGVGR